MWGKDHRGLWAPPYFLLQIQMLILAWMSLQSSSVQKAKKTYSPLHPVPTICTIPITVCQYHTKKANTTSEFSGKLCFFASASFWMRKIEDLGFGTLACYQQFLSNSSIYHFYVSFGHMTMCTSLPAVILIWDCMPAKVRKKSKRQLVEERGGGFIKW